MAHSDGTTTLVGLRESITKVGISGGSNGQGQPDYNSKENDTSHEPSTITEILPSSLDSSNCGQEQKCDLPVVVPTAESYASEKSITPDILEYIQNFSTHLARMDRARAYNLRAMERRRRARRCFVETQAPSLSMFVGTGEPDPENDEEATMVDDDDFDDYDCYDDDIYDSDFDDGFDNESDCTDFTDTVSEVDSFYGDCSWEAQSKAAIK